VVGACHEPGGASLRRALISNGYKLGLDGVSPHRSWPQLTSNSWRCSLSMNRPLTPSLSPSEGERVPEERVRGWFHMVSTHRENERELPRNQSLHPFPAVQQLADKALCSCFTLRTPDNRTFPVCEPSRSWWDSRPGKPDGQCRADTS